jgi:hypothetical protein
MSPAILLAGLLIGPHSTTETDAGRIEYHSVMAATSDRAAVAADVAVPRLVDLYRSLEEIELPRHERSRMKRAIEGRLVRQLETLLRQQQRLRRTERAIANSGGGAVAAQQLIDLIVSTIAPDSWRQNGGNGTITYYPYNPALVIRTTSETHEQVGELLRALGK